MNYQKGQFLTFPNKDIMKGKSPQLQTIYLWICSFADDQGECFPSIQTIADCAGCSRNSVIKEIKELEALGILVKQNRFKNKEKTSNLYQIKLIEVGGSAGDGLPSAGDGLGGSAGDGHRTNSTLLTKSKELLAVISCLKENGWLEKKYPAIDMDWLELEVILMLEREKTQKKPIIKRKSFAGRWLDKNPYKKIKPKKTEPDREYERTRPIGVSQ